jgi:HK97 gp10 family phage protein
MSSVAVNVEGFDKLVAQIRKLANDKDKRREMLILLRQIANPTLKAAKVFAPVSKRKHKARGKIIAPGNLKKSLGTITGKSENPTILVGPRAKGNFDGWYGNFVEKGHNIYSKGFKRKRSGTSRAKLFNAGGAKKRTRASMFMSRTYDQTKGLVTVDAEKKMAAYIQKQIDRLSR